MQKSIMEIYAQFEIVICNNDLSLTKIIAINEMLCSILYHMDNFIEKIDLSMVCAVRFLLNKSSEKRDVFIDQYQFLKAESN